ncbi:MAG: site-specific DNA-methyltransferase [Gammaproteobacteria bacterium]|nr:site-specific DNA-methyltransferase [Gammaproteobacteria bacterium]
MNGKSLNITEEKLARLREVLPEAFAEGAIDWEKLRVMLTRDGEFKDERYHLNWAGKTEAYRALQAPTTATLAPCREESVGFDGAGHVFIEGENLAVLKVLQKACFGKVKMIYIDPPYNTGNDHFIYPDRFAMSKKGYQKRVGDMDDEGHLTREGLFRKNSRENGHYHSNWLSMIYPRLFLARNLLREDGVIFVSIDDNEVHNLRLVMNEIFGEENFVACLTVKTNPGGRDYGGIARTHEYVLCYSRSDGTELNAIIEEDKKFPMSDERGGFEPRELRNRNVRFNSDNRPNLYYPFYVNKTACDSNELHEVSLEKVKGWVEVYPLESRGIKTVWRWGKEKSMQNLNTEIMGKKKRDGAFQIVEKYRSKEKRERSILDAKCMRNEHGTIVLKDVFREKTIFDYPKSHELIKRLIELAGGKDSTVLDFFAGSCTTAHAVLELNKEDGGARKFICVQMPEACDEKSEARKAGFKTIADIGKERIRRVIKNGRLNAGLKVFKLRESNFKPWRGDVQDAAELAAQMQLHTDPVVDGAQTECILYELLLKSGVSLTAPLRDHGGWYLAEDAGAKIAVALTRIDAATLKDILAAEPDKVITLDRLFQGNDQLKTNTALQMGDAGVGFEVV